MISWRMIQLRMIRRMSEYDHWRMMQDDADEDDA